MPVLDDIIATKGISVEFRIRRYTVAWPTGPSNEYKSPPFYGSEIAELTNEQDITYLCAGYSQEFDDSAIIDSAELRVVAEWGDTSYKSLLEPKTYVIIEERYRSLNGSIDTDWISRGHYLVDGIVNEQRQEDGRKAVTIAMRSVLSLVQLEKFVGELTPDRLLITRRKALWTNSGTYSTDGFYKFQIEVYEGSSGIEPIYKYHQNWDERSSVKIWLVYTTGSEHDGETLQLRSGQGSVQIVGGEGAVVIDKDFFEKTWEDGGLEMDLGKSPPDELHVEFWRYATEIDVSEREIIAVSDASSGQHASIEVTPAFEEGYSNENKTVWVKDPDSDADGRRYRVAVQQAPGTTMLVGTSETGTGWTFDTGPPATDVEDEQYAKSGATNTNFLKIKGFDASAIDDADEITGFEIVRFVAKANTGIASQPVIAEVAFSLDDGATMSPLFKTIENIRGDVPIDYGPIGGPNELFGLTPTATQVKDTGNFCAMVRRKSGPGGLDLDFFGIRIWYRSASGINSTTRLFLINEDGSAATPVADGLTIGDSVVVGDANTLEVAIEKILRADGFQQHDPDKPFYINNLAEPTVGFGPIRIPPMRATVQDRRDRIELLEDVLSGYGLPNYQLFTNADGSVSSGEIVQAGSPQFSLADTLAVKSKTDDLNIFTRVIARGTKPFTLNLCSKAFGSRAGKYIAGPLFNNADIEEIIDDNSLTPVAGGVLRRRKNSEWDFGDDTTLCWIDLGQDRILEEFLLSFAPFAQGAASRAQIFRLYYMTEQDYINAGHGMSPPPPNTGPPAESIGWKLLVDDFKCEDGAVTLPAREWLTGQPTRMRWIKIFVPQWYVYLRLALAMVAWSATVPGSSPSSDLLKASVPFAVFSPNQPSATPMS